MTDVTASSSSPSTAPAPRRSRRHRLLALLAIGGLLVGAVGFFRHFYLTHPIGSGPAGQTVVPQDFASVWSDRKVLLLGFGDSITAGYGASPQHSFFDRLVANPEDEYPDMAGICLSRVLPKLDAMNLGLSGSTSIEHVNFLLPKVTRQNEDTFGVIVLTTGGNDVIHNYGRTPPREGAMYGATVAQAQEWIANFEERLDGMLAALRERFPGGCHFFLANIYDPTDEDGDVVNAGLPRWPDGLLVLKAYNDILVNIHDLFLGHGIHCRQPWHRHYQSHDPTYWYFDNLEDPNDRGYDAIRRLLLLEMARVLPARL